MEGETVAAVSTPVLAEDAIFPAEGNERVKERPGCYLVINKVSRDYDATNPPPFPNVNITYIYSAQIMHSSAKSMPVFFSFHYILH